MSVLERLVVSRKTPGDGRLLLSSASAVRLADLAAELRVEWDGRSAPARLVSMTCSCGKGGEAPHVHHFLESPLLAELPPGGHVELDLPEDAEAAGGGSGEGHGTIRVVPL